jgi:hypothetical protein
MYIRRKRCENYFEHINNYRTSLWIFVVHVPLIARWCGSHCIMCHCYSTPTNSLVWHAGVGMPRPLSRTIYRIINGLTINKNAKRFSSTKNCKLVIGRLHRQSRAACVSSSSPSFHHWGWTKLIIIELFIVDRRVVVALRSGGATHKLCSHLTTPFFHL